MDFLNSAAQHVSVKRIPVAIKRRIRILFDFHFVSKGAVN